MIENPSLIQVTMEIQVFTLSYFDIGIDGRIYFDTTTYQGFQECFTVTPSNPEYLEILKLLQEVKEISSYLKDTK